jgi:hypothetical protein
LLLSEEEEDEEEVAECSSFESEFVDVAISFCACTVARRLCITETSQGIEGLDLQIFRKF